MLLEGNFKYFVFIMFGEPPYILPPLFRGGGSVSYTNLVGGGGPIYTPQINADITSFSFIVS